MTKKKVIIMGAAGRDFHNFNTNFRGNPDYEVVCFTATQIPGIDDKKYPVELAGDLYPQGIPIVPEEKIKGLIKEHDIDEVVFAYSDVANDYVMHKAAIVNAAGADFKLIGTKTTMVKSTKPVIAICAVRTGCGKSQVTRFVSKLLQDQGKKVVAIRHPMPYGDLAKQAVQRFETYEDFDKHECTIEEREEYEVHVEKGIIVYAGVDYEAILRQAEQEADVIIWDGGNNDTSFYKPDLMITIVDPHRPGHELKYYPGETNVRMADLVIINKEDTAQQSNIDLVRKNVQEINPGAKILDAESVISVDQPELIEGKNVLIIEDGPTLTHGGMKYGAGFFAAKNHNATPVNPEPYAVGELKETMHKFNHNQILPAMGYSESQIEELKTTISAVDCDAVIIGTPMNLPKLIPIGKPFTRVNYDLKEKQEGTLKELVLKLF